MMCTLGAHHIHSKSIFHLGTLPSPDVLGKAEDVLGAVLKTAPYSTEHVLIRALVAMLVTKLIIFTALGYMQQVPKCTDEYRFLGFSDLRNTNIRVLNPKNQFFEKVPLRHP